MGNQKSTNIIRFIGCTNFIRTFKVLDSFSDFKDENCTETTIMYTKHAKRYG